MRASCRAGLLPCILFVLGAVLSASDKGAEEEGGRSNFASGWGEVGADEDAQRALLRGFEHCHRAHGHASHFDPQEGKCVCSTGYADVRGQCLRVQPNAGALVPSHLEGSSQAEQGGRQGQGGAEAASDSAVALVRPSHGGHAVGGKSFAIGARQPSARERFKKASEPMTASSTLVIKSRQAATLTHDVWHGVFGGEAFPRESVSPFPQKTHGEAP
jgi:hypothetical protein